MFRETIKESYQKTGKKCFQATLKGERRGHIIFFQESTRYISSILRQEITENGDAIKQNLRSASKTSLPKSRYFIRLIFPSQDHDMGNLTDTYYVPQITALSHETRPVKLRISQRQSSHNHFMQVRIILQRTMRAHAYHILSDRGIRTDDVNDFRGQNQRAFSPDIVYSSTVDTIIAHTRGYYVFCTYDEDDDAARRRRSLVAKAGFDANKYGVYS